MMHIDAYDTVPTYKSRVADPHHLNADPNPAFQFNADPDPAFHFNEDPDPHFTADPDLHPAPHQSDRNLRPPVYVKPPGLHCECPRPPSSVADPGCLPRIRVFPLPDPIFFHPGPRIRLKEFKYFNQKK
jgi:hypothetical protein